MMGSAETHHALASAGDLRRSEGLMLLVRAAAIPWAALQVLTYTTRPYPAGVKTAGLAIVGVLAAGNLLAWLARARIRSERGARILAIATTTLDVLVVSAFAWLFAFDQESALWAVLLIIPLEGAVRFRLGGALATWSAVTVLYVGREIWGSDRYGYRLQWDSVSFRMGIGLLIALVAGLMARDLVRQRKRLEVANENLRRVDEIRAALITTLAHDVRNPLAAIRGTFHVLLTHPDFDPRLRELVAATDRASNRLQRLSLALLDLARLEQGKLELELADVDLAPVVAAAIGFADADGVVESVLDSRLRVHADRDRLEQVLVNLVTNACRYGRPPLLVSAELRDGLVLISVTDHGPGMSDVQVATLFQSFQASEGKGSIGFGLTIVKSLTEAQGGRVRYERNEPTGSRFVVEIPAARADHDHTRAAT